MTERLARLRKTVADTDREILALLNRRAELSREIGKAKEQTGKAVYDPAREKDVFRRLREENPGPLDGPAVEAVFREIVSACRALQAPLRVAFLGPEGSFSHGAALLRFGSGAVPVPRQSIFHVFDAAEREQADFAVVPAENSLEGAVNLTLDRLVSTNLNLVGEVLLPVHHHLLARDPSLEGLKRVYSHPQALAQCQMWLRKHLPACGWIETASTAEGARKAREDREGAALGSEKAAEIHGLCVVRERVEDHPANVTRFLVLGRLKAAPTGNDKTSVLFGTRHVPGALRRALEPFAEEQVNLLKILSHPWRDRIWEYLFFADFAGHREDEKIGRCLASLEREVPFLKILGSYPAAEERP